MNDPYLEGAKAFHDGKPKWACPYADGTPDRTVWRAGWRSAEQQEQELKEAA